MNKKEDENKIEVVGMIMLDKYVEFLRLYRIRNGYNIRSSLGVIFITRKMRENKLR